MHKYKNPPQSPFRKGGEKKDEEHQHQVALFQWARLHERKMPELKLLFAVPNGGLRNPAVAGKLKAEGVKAGVPDILLPVARKGYYGLAIEMKSRTGRLGDDQKEWLRALEDVNWKTAVCYSEKEASAVITDYLNLGDE